MEEQWTQAVEEDLQVLAQMARWSPIKDRQVAPAPHAVVEERPVPMQGRDQQAQLAQMTVEAYERWAVTYPGPADALERAMERVEAEAQRYPVESMPTDWVDEETLPLLYGQEPEAVWTPPVVQVEQYLAWTLPHLTAMLVRWLHTWPRHAPLLT